MDSRTKAILETHDIAVDCESPIDLSHEEGTATGYLAELLIQLLVEAEEGPEG